MATWNSRGLRGSTLEEMINYTNEKYREKGLALVQKIPTPIKPVKIDQESRHITLAYFEQKSTVDYIGAVQGIPVCFDAKECAKDTFVLSNIHEHQVKFMEEFERQNGISFFLIYFSHREESYYLRFSELKKYWERQKQGHPKNFKYGELDLRFFIPSKSGVQIHYLETLSKDLQSRNSKVL
ncbi:MAG: Holliday junction resolvase RecU [Lachnospiraceae bacterium]